jgi:hypothetical protein
VKCIRRTRKSVIVICLLAMTLWGAQACARSYIPWDILTQDSWIDFDQFPELYPRLYPVNDGNSYPIAFSQAKAYNKAAGMNALKFVYNDQTTGRMVSTDTAGSFAILNNGSNDFAHIFIVAAINVGSRAPDFVMSLNPQGASPYLFDPNHFGFYDNPFGRPSGYYSITDPNHDGIAYAFETGMVTVYRVEAMPLPNHQQSLPIYYSFNYLPGPVVFSVYGFIAPAPGDPHPEYQAIYHTNKAFIDKNDSGGLPVSTFAVTVPADMNKDLKVDFTDFALLAQNWLITTDYADLAQLAHDWLFGAR